MKQRYEEPELTFMLRELDRAGLDPAAFIELDPTSPRDEEILGMDVEGYDYVQVVLSRVTGVNHVDERQTYMTRHLPIEAVKNYLRGKYGGDR